MVPKLGVGIKDGSGALLLLQWWYACCCFLRFEIWQKESLLLLNPVFATCMNLSDRHQPGLRAYVQQL